MTLFNDIIDQFGRSIGMEGVQLRDNGALVLDMQRLGRLAFEVIDQHGDDITMSLSRHVELTDDNAGARILELCHYRSPAPFPARAGLTQKGDLIFAVRMTTAEFTLPNLHQSLDWLSALQDQSQSFAQPARM